MESWDDDNFEPPTVLPTDAVAANKWEGEDEEEDVKESWEDEEEEKVETTAATTTPTEEAKPKPKKQTLAEKIAEKERRKREEMERRLKEQQEEEEITAEEKLRMQQESDLKMALETTFGGDQNTNHSTSAGLEGMELPTTKEEFQDFADNLSKKLLPLSKSTEYPQFAENLLRNLCATMSSLDIKKIKNTLDNLYLEKQKIEKGEKSKKNKGKGKAKLKMDDNNPLSAYVNEYDDYDDFM